MQYIAGFYSYIPNISCILTVYGRPLHRQMTSLPTLKSVMLT